LKELGVLVLNDGVKSEHVFSVLFLNCGNWVFFEAPFQNIYDDDGSGGGG
jgi:hypothetical protein